MSRGGGNSWAAPECEPADNAFEEAGDPADRGKKMTPRRSRHDKLDPAYPPQVKDRELRSEQEEKGEDAATEGHG